MTGSPPAAASAIGTFKTSTPTYQHIRGLALLQRIKKLYFLFHTFGMLPLQILYVHLYRSRRALAGRPGYNAEVRGRPLPWPRHFSTAK
jgi:hypothetical protein